MRRDVALPRDDVKYLDSAGLEWETVKQANQKALIIRAFAIPEGYNVSSADLLLLLEGYPDAQIDMVYFFPFLSVDGKVIKAIDATLNFDDRVWQRWSRHRTPENPWRQGEDDICTHLSQVEHWLRRELA